MSEFTTGNRISRKATADLTASQYCAVKLDSNSQAVLATAATDQVIGFLQNAPVAKDTADIAVRNGSGTVKAKAGAAFAVGVKLMIDSTGRVITAATTGNEIVGIAFEASTAANQIVEVMPCFDRV